LANPKNLIQIRIQIIRIFGFHAHQRERYPTFGKLEVSNPSINTGGEIFENIEENKEILN